MSNEQCPLETVQDRLITEVLSPHPQFQCIAPKNVAAERNSQREPERQYSEEILSALVLRYEDPMSNNRWDSPLFNFVNDQLDEICDQINQALFERRAPRPNESTQAVRRFLDSKKILSDSWAILGRFRNEDQSSQSMLISPPPLTAQIPKSDNNFLQSIDSKTKSIVEQIMKAQEFGQLKNIQIDDCKLQVALNKKLTIIELNKFRRQFISFIRKFPTPVDQISSSFVQYLNVNCNA